MGMIEPAAQEDNRERKDVEESQECPERTTPPMIRIDLDLDGEIYEELPVRVMMQKSIDQILNENKGFETQLEELEQDARANRGLRLNELERQERILRAHHREHLLQQIREKRVQDLDVTNDLLRDRLSDQEDTITSLTKRVISFQLQICTERVQNEKRFQALENLIAKSAPVSNEKTRIDAEKAEEGERCTQEIESALLTILRFAKTSLQRERSELEGLLTATAIREEITEEHKFQGEEEEEEKSVLDQIENAKADLRRFCRTKTKRKDKSEIHSTSEETAKVPVGHLEVCVQVHGVLVQPLRTRAARDQVAEFEDAAETIKPKQLEDMVEVNALLEELPFKEEFEKFSGGEIVTTRAASPETFEQVEDAGPEEMNDQLDVEEDSETSAEETATCSVDVESEDESEESDAENEDSNPDEKESSVEEEEGREDSGGEIEMYTGTERVAFQEGETATHAQTGAINAEHETARMIFTANNYGNNDATDQVDSVSISSEEEQSEDEEDSAQPIVSPDVPAELEDDAELFSELTMLFDTSAQLEARHEAPAEFVEDCAQPEEMPLACVDTTAQVDEESEKGCSSPEEISIPQVAVQSEIPHTPAALEGESKLIVVTEEMALPDVTAQVDSPHTPTELKEGSDREDRELTAPRAESKPEAITPTVPNQEEERIETERMTLPEVLATPIGEEYFNKKSGELEDSPQPMASPDAITEPQVPATTMVEEERFAEETILSEVAAAYQLHALVEESDEKDCAKPRVIVLLSATALPGEAFQLESTAICASAQPLVTLVIEPMIQFHVDEVSALTLHEEDSDNEENASEGTFTAFVSEAINSACETVSALLDSAKRGIDASEELSEMAELVREE